MEVSAETALPGLQTATCAAPHGASPPHARAPPVSVWVQIASSCQNTSHIGLGTTRMTSFNLNHPFKGPVTFRGPGWLGRQHTYFREWHESVHNTYQCRTLAERHVPGPLEAFALHLLQSRPVSRRPTEEMPWVPGGRHSKAPLTEQ